MGQILPFRHARGPSTEVDCEICEQPINPGEGYPVMSDNTVDGWVCTDCFAVSQDMVDEVGDPILKEHLRYKTN